MTDADRTRTLVQESLRKAGYGLICWLGRGGMGEIWAAVRFGVGGVVKPCAVKVIRPIYADNEGYRQRFVLEGQVAMMLSHANIVPVFEIGVVDRLLFMAMDWVDGVDLTDFRSRAQVNAGGRPLGVDTAVHIVAGLLDALDYAHGFCVGGFPHGIVHRDISPRNVMITSHGEIKLMDFGLAEVGTEARTGPRFQGTLRYLSREQARGRPEAASDLFATGAILHELLDGRTFRHECVTDEALVCTIFEQGIPPLTRPVPWPVERLRRALLEPRPELRIKTADRALSTLIEWPGFRNCGLKLKRIYRKVFGRPRSRLTQLLARGDIDRTLLERLKPCGMSPSVEPIAASRDIDDGGIDYDGVPHARPRERASLHRCAWSQPAMHDESLEVPDEPDEHAITRARPVAPPANQEEEPEFSATAWLGGPDSWRTADDDGMNPPAP